MNSQFILVLHMINALGLPPKEKTNITACALYGVSAFSKQNLVKRFKECRDRKIKPIYLGDKKVR